MKTFRSTRGAVTDVLVRISCAYAVNEVYMIGFWEL
jgi:hypothetical protein